MAPRAAAAGAALALLRLAALAHAAPSAVLTSAPQMVYNYTRDHCPRYAPMPPKRCVPNILAGCDPDIPDACTRAWATPAGAYRMLGSVDGVSRAQTGASLDALAHSCGAPYANATYDPDLAHFRDHEWVEAPAVVNASAVYALTHADSIDAAGQYLYTSVTLFASLDGGLSFAPARPPPAHLVATTPYDNTNVSLGVKGAGFGMPSSILRDPRSGYFYALVLSSWGEPVRAQRGGLCLLRTPDVTDPGSWRAWNGSAFAATLNASPLLGPVADPDAHTCAPLADTSGAPIAMRHLSLLWSSFYGRFLLFGEAAAGGALNQTAGWAFALSDDLVRWDPPVRVALAGLLDPAGNATAQPAAPMPGRFIKTAGSNTMFEAPGAAWKAALGSCTPCPGLDACALAVEVPGAEFAGVPNATFAFSCTHVYDVGGYSGYFYSVLVDDAAHRATGADPSLNIVGQDAHLFFVAKKCAGVTWDHKAGDAVACTPLDGYGRDQRDIVRATIRFGA